MSAQPSLLAKCIVGDLPLEGGKGKYEVLFSPSFPALLLMPLSTSEGDKGRKTQQTEMCFIPPPFHSRNKCVA